MAKPGFFWRLKWLLLLLFMMVLDFSPIPFSAAVCIYIFLARPAGFKRFVDRLYATE
jgi:hypothetical protein